MEINMNEHGLIDMFGLSGDRGNDDQLDDLFFRLESETLTVSNGISKNKAPLPFIITTGTPAFMSEQTLLKFK